MSLNNMNSMNDRNEEVKESRVQRKKCKAEDMRSIILAYGIFLVAWALVIHIVFTQILVSAHVPSGSMEPTLNVGDRYIGNRLAYKDGATPERYDVVMFYAPDEPETLYVKRVIGLPGETVTIKNGKVYIDDSEIPLDDSFILETMDYEAPMVFRVPMNCYFMMGDNRNESYDSRYWDNPYVSLGAIIAKASIKYWGGLATL